MAAHAKTAIQNSQTHAPNAISAQPYLNRKRPIGKATAIANGVTQNTRISFGAAERIGTTAPFPHASGKSLTFGTQPCSD
jgi:hypothetical protein